MLWIPSMPKSNENGELDQHNHYKKDPSHDVVVSKENK